MSLPHRPYAHDQRCFDLAEYFLDEEHSEERKSDLAQHIQEAIEEWLRMNAPMPVLSPGDSGAAEGRT